MKRSPSKNGEGMVAEPSVAEYVVKNRLQAADEAIHGWYRFVLGYPPHLVREYLQLLDAQPDRDWVLDPFCGTATTPLEAKLRGYATLSCDANPISVLAARVKLNWDVALDQVEAGMEEVVQFAAGCLRSVGMEPFPEGNSQLSLFGPACPSPCGADSRAERFIPGELLPAEASSLIPQDFISRKPLLRVLALRCGIETLLPEGDVRDFMRLGLANTIVSTAGNVGFGPEVYRLPPKEDADVLGAFAGTVSGMVADLRAVLCEQARPFPEAVVFQDDARSLAALDACPPIGVVITSPPYPNEKDYTRSTRLESVLLGFLSGKSGLRAVKSRLLRSNTRNVFAGDADDSFVADLPSVVHVADEIEATRLKLGKTSGFERQYHRVARLYFGGMYRHLSALLPRLRPGARCAYVVGDQMSFFRVHIRTAHLLADVAAKAGFRVEGIELWRTRRSTTTGLDLEENVLILRRPTTGGGPHGPQRW